MNESLERGVRERARHRCEYCRIPAFVSEFTFPIDHIVAQQHGGETASENLALSCPHCNHHKGPNLTGIDRVSKTLTRLFNPRRNRWGALRVGWARNCREDGGGADDALCPRDE